jgi:ketosteroid isomerase-like protein
MRPDVALVHWSWRIDGDRNVDGSAREPRLGLMTMVVAKRKGRWSIAAAQNTNATSGSPPEAEGIRSPIDVHPEPK